MFGLKPKKQQTVEIPEPEKAQPVMTPCDDEPGEWSSLSEQELAAKWYRLESISINPDGMTPQVNCDDFKWYQQAAGQGDRCAQYALGKMYHRGILTQQALFQAGLWYSKASEAGSPFADYELAKMCEYGVSMKKDSEMASDLYRRAYQELTQIESRKPDYAVEKKLAALCGKNIAIDPQEAERWKQLAESQRQPETVQETPPSNSHKIVPKASSKEPCAESRPEKSSSMDYEEIPAKFIFPDKNNQYAEKDTEDSIHALAVSIQVHGLIEPLALQKISDSEYRIVAGERRFKAITHYLHWKTIPSIVKSDLSDASAQSMLNAANLHVRKYSAGQMLLFYQDYEKQLQKMKKSGEYSGSLQEGIAELLGVSSHQVHKYQRIVESLPKRQLRQIRDGKLSIEKAYKMTLCSQNSVHESMQKRTDNPYQGMPPSNAKPDVVYDQKPRQFHDHNTVEIAADLLKNTGGRTSGYGISPDAVLNPISGQLHVSQSQNNATEILEYSAGHTTDLVEIPDVVHGTKKEPDSVLPDVPDKPQKGTGRTSGFEGNSDVVHGQNSERPYVRESAIISTQIPENPPNSTSCFSRNPDVARDPENGSDSGSTEAAKKSDDKAGRMSVPDVQSDAIHSINNDLASAPTDGSEGSGKSFEGASGFEIISDVIHGSENNADFGSANVPGIAGNGIGCTSVSDAKPDVAYGRKNDRKSIPLYVPDRNMNPSGRASAYNDPENYLEALKLLSRLPIVPGESCVTQSGGEAFIGKIDHISLYKNIILIFVKVGDTQESYPVSMIGQTLFPCPSDSKHARGS